MRLTGNFVDPRPAAVARIGIAFALLMNAFEVREILMKLAEGSLAMPTILALPTPNEMHVRLWFFACLLAGGLLAAGWRADIAAGLAAMLGAVGLMWDMQAYSNHVFLTTLLCAYLAFARSDAAWSLRAMLRRQSDPPRVPWWPQLLMMTQLSACYLFAGLCKLNPWWLTGDMLERVIWWPLPQMAFQSMATATIVIEIFLAAGLWFRASRRVAILLGLLLHLGIVAMVRDPLPLVAFAIVCVSLYPLFMSRPPLISAGRGRH